MRGLLAALLFTGFAVAPSLACENPARANGDPATQRLADLVPALGAGIDSALKQGTIPQASLNIVLELREKMAKLAAAGDEMQARTVEEKAMGLLGYRKAWLACSRGAFVWMQVPAEG